MAIPHFASEADFRKKWIAPFLTKLGYVLVTHSHGSGEQGKDFFFADYDRFEHRRFYAVQVKLGDIGAGQTELDGLLNQISRCFTVRIRNYREADEKRISAVYVMASGSISMQAREYISDFCKAQPYGENVYFLDGDRLDHLNRFVDHHFDQQLRSLLSGLLNEVHSNLLPIERARAAFSSHQGSFLNCRHSALDQILVSPPPNDLIRLDVLNDAWLNVTLLNKLCDYHVLPISISDELWQERVMIADRTLAAMVKVRDEIEKAMRALDDKYAISVEILEDKTPTARNKG